MTEFPRKTIGDAHLDEYAVFDAYLDPDDSTITVAFQREVNGIMILSETLKFTFSLNGEMISAYTVDYGKMDGLIEELTEERLKAAEEKLRSAFSEKDRVQDDKYIYLDETTGICYLELSANAESYYINII